MATVAEELRHVDRLLDVPAWGWSSPIPAMQQMREAQAKIRQILAALDRAKEAA